MGNHDRYEVDILKALQRIATSLDKIEKKMPDKMQTMNELNDFENKSKTIAKNYNIDNIHAKCFLVNHGDSKNICDGCQDHKFCLMLKDKEEK